jgi:hypothetical protein
MKILFIISIINCMRTYVSIQLSLYFSLYFEDNHCYRLKTEKSCKQEPGCIWCSNDSWNGIYHCYDTLDDTECSNNIISDCVKTTRCYYCIINMYATQTCFKSLFSPKKYYNID